MRWTSDLRKKRPVDAERQRMKKCGAARPASQATHTRLIITRSYRTRTCRHQLRTSNYNRCCTDCTLDQSSFISHESRCPVDMWSLGRHRQVAFQLILVWGEQKFREECSLAQNKNRHREEENNSANSTVFRCIVHQGTTEREIGW